MTCEFRGACSGLPICFEGCGKCGKHCACADSEAKALAGRLSVRDARRATLEAHEGEVQHLRNLVRRYQLRWKRTKRLLDEIASARLSRLGIMNFLADLRKEMDRDISKTDPDWGPNRQRGTS